MSLISVGAAARRAYQAAALAAAAALDACVWLPLGARLPVFSLIIMATLVVRLNSNLLARSLAPPRARLTLAKFESFTGSLKFQISTKRARLPVRMWCVCVCVREIIESISCLSMCVSPHLVRLPASSLILYALHRH